MDIIFVYFNSNRQNRMNCRNTDNKLNKRPFSNYTARGSFNIQKCQTRLEEELYKFSNEWINNSDRDPRMLQRPLIMQYHERHFINLYNTKSEPKRGGMTMLTLTSFRSLACSCWSGSMKFCLTESSREYFTSANCRYDSPDSHNAWPEFNHSHLLIR